MYFDLLHRIKLSFSKDRELYCLFYKTLGFYPRNIKYYREAMIHSSAQVRDKNGKYIDNERLEFLGDAVLDAAVADILFKRFPTKREGFLTNTRSKIVQREHLNELGIKLGLPSLVKVCLKSGSSHNNYIYGNALEAIIGAIYLDRGYRFTMSFIEHTVIDRELSEFARQEKNYKSRLIEWAQRNHYPFEFRLDKTLTDDTDSPVFYSSVWINGVRISDAKGYTKKESHQLAAKKAMRKIRFDKAMLDAITRGAVAEVAPETNSEQTPESAVESSSVTE
ncbi:MAG: ribonuclease III [Muribaculaceae bacterium]|nr:ribonuclease III [Muribaculaceae bacterium]